MTQPGTKLGRYEIRSKIGEGGMDEVYRARDGRLNRDVAIKILPASLSENADRVNRFEQEAQAASALNHPNILIVYDVGAHDGASYVVSEGIVNLTSRRNKIINCNKMNPLLVSWLLGSVLIKLSGRQLPLPKW